MGILCRDTHGHTIRLTPSLVVSADHLARAGDVVDEFL